MLIFLVAWLTLPTTYTLMPDSSDDIKAAVNHTVEHMSFITRPIARGRLNKTNPLPQHVRVTQTNDTIAVAFDDGNPITTPLDGNTVPWQSSMTHEQYQAHAIRMADTTAQVIVAPDGERTNAYVFTNNGERLELHVTISSHRLPQPLTYTLRFRRDASSPHD
jgi:hypothetical protein